ncbi:TetR/AcrR family transcriptional regulator C-terminal domain-containing protein [Nonomuraea sp. NPDC050328]|uniref:TetR/AcrR family transcriptional regulator C-terminal domain-containing protein n=1 Tax=Nonomuraea sp. NPDC050328 TaxID=3364361 RepID=UPI00378B4695
MTAPYLRIADDLRRRLARLRPGDRVPSTRQLVRDQGVALATAAKALDVLRQEGLIEAVPRVGYVVAAPARPRPRRRPAADALDVGRIVAAALDLADEEGLDAVSMRGLAGRLGVPAMSLYRHVPDKDALIVLLGDAGFADFAEPEQVTGWRDRLAASARAQWALYRRRPWLAQLNPLGRPIPSPNLARHADFMMASLEGLGLSADTQMTLHITLFSYVRGIAANLEAEARAQAESGVDEDDWMDRQGREFEALAATGSYPAFARVLGGLAAGYDFNLDTLFEFGLNALLEGFAGIIREAGYDRADPELF